MNEEQHEKPSIIGIIILLLSTVCLALAEFLEVRELGEHGMVDTKIAMVHWSFFATCVLGIATAVIAIFVKRMDRLPSWAANPTGSKTE